MKKDQHSEDRIKVYGYMVIYKRPGEERWSVDQCEEYEMLPAHYDFPEQAVDRVAWLRGRGLQARVGALLSEKSDVAEFLKEDSAS